MGFVTNVAAAVVHSFDQAKTVGEIYNLGETTVRTKRLWASMFAEAAGFEFDYRVVPDELLEKEPSVRNNPPCHLIFDCNKFIRETGFVEPVPVEQALQLTLDWGLAHPEALGDKPDYDGEDRLLKNFASLMDRLYQVEQPALGLAVLHHVELYVSDLAKSREFWGWLLGRMGYKPQMEWSVGLSYDIDGTKLSFVQAKDGYQDQPYHRKRVGMNHLAFHAPSRGALDGLAADLRMRGVTVLYGSPIVDGDTYAVFFEDPDRIKVEYTAEAAA